MKGLTKFLLLNLNFINSKYIIKVIFISKNLSKTYNLKNNKFIVLHDACDLKDFKSEIIIKKKVKKILYLGSFYKGRGIEVSKTLKINTKYRLLFIWSER